MSERDAQLEELVDSLLASTVTPKVEGFLKEKRTEIVERYGTDKPHIDVVREKIHQKQPSQVIKPIDVALELRDAIEAVERRNFILPLAMFHIGALFSYFEVCLEDRDVPSSLKESYRRMAAAEDGRKPHEPRQERLKKLLDDHLRTIEDSYLEGDDFTQVEATDWLLGLYPELIKKIIKIMEPPTIRTRRRDEWTADDEKYYARKILMKNVKPISEKYGRVFGHPGVRKSKS